MGLPSVEVEGLPCWYKKMEADKFVLVREQLGHKDYCPLCRERLNREGHIYLFLCNNKLFPNVLCHGHCVDERGVAEAAAWLAMDYRRAEEHLGEFRCWFPEEP